MKDEIKEILEYLKALANGKWIMLDLSNEEYKMLYDYITNLQEENERLKERCEYLERSNNRREDEIMSLRDECVDGETYKSRNEKAIEYMNNYIEVEDAPINERIKTEFKEVIRLLTGGDK